MRIATGFKCPVVAIAAALLAATSVAARGEIIADGTLGPRASLAGPNFAVTSGLGRQLGANLFHSFSQFNLATGESATFSGPASVANIIGRVTGGSGSYIDGLLRSTIANANLYLINPKGVTFGPNASLDVSGAFHASTADYLKFADGARFYASNPETSTFTSTAPAAFGFVTSAPAGISANGTSLGVASGKALSLVGGDIRLDGATLSAPSGRVNLASAASAGEIALEPAGIAAQSMNKFGAVTLSNTLIDTGNIGETAAGAIHIRGGRFVLENSTLYSANTAFAAGGSISAVLADEIVLNGGTIFTSSAGKGNGGAIYLEAPAVTLDNGGFIHSTTSDTGASGAIALKVSTLNVANGAYIKSVTTGSGEGGAITIDAGERVAVTGGNGQTLDKRSQISSYTYGSGNAGALNIKAPVIEVSDGAGIFIDVEVGANGRGGSITIDAGERVTVTGGDSQISGFTYGSGNAGSLNIKSPSIEVSDGARIFSDTAKGASGSGGRVGIVTSALRLSRDGSITAINQGSGTGGNIDIAAVSIDISGGKAYPAGLPDPATGLTYYGFYSGLYVTSQFGATGRGGQVRINADTLRISDGGVISGVALGAGDAGNFNIDARSVSLDNGGLIHTSTSGAGAAGSITLTAKESFYASGQLDPAKYSGFAPRGATASGIRSRATLELNPTSPVLGNAGAIVVTAPVITLADSAEFSTSAALNALGGTIALTAGNIDITRGASVSAASFGSGNAGSIAIQSGHALRLQDGGAVTTEARSADGGNIDIAVGTLVRLSDSKITTSVGTGLGNGGNISIDPQFVVLNHSRIIANAYGGNGGNIRIAAQNYLASPDSVVEASSQLGIAGTVRITSPNSDVGAGLAVLPAKFFDAASMLRETCALRMGSNASSFVAVGRGGLPASPDGFLVAMPDWGMPGPVAAAAPARHMAGTPRDTESANLALRVAGARAGLRCGG